MNNKLVAKMEFHTNTDGQFTTVKLCDGEECVFTTTLIPDRYKVVADLLHSTLEVAIGFGIIRSEPDV